MTHALGLRSLTAFSVGPPARARAAGGPNQAGTWWRQKMQSLALRISKRRMRRHASGAVMKHGPSKRAVGRGGAG